MDQLETCRIIRSPTRVFYSQAMVAESGSSVSPSAAKPAVVANALKESDIPKNLGIGIAWTLAGGYQKDKDGGIAKVVEIHLDTFRAALDVQAG